MNNMNNNIDNLVSKLNNSFYQTTKSVKLDTDKLYEYQIEYTYLIDEIQRGPSYLIKKRVMDINDLLDDIIMG